MKARVNSSTKPEASLAGIGARLSANMFMPNQEKTELIIFKPKHQLKVSDYKPFQIGEIAFHVALSIKNFGVHFDTSVAMKRKEMLLS